MKKTILANDLVRRLSNMGKTMTINDHVEVVDMFTFKLKASEYSQGQAREIVISGLGSTRAILRGGRGKAKKMLSSRVRKKLFEKTTLYKQTKDNTAQDDQAPGRH